MTETSEMYSTIEDAFNFFDERLFGGSLPHPIFTLQRQSKTAGYYSRRSFKEIKGDTYVDEIALNPNHFVAKGEIENMQTLVHEMVHMWQYHFGTPSQRTYHNKEFALKMKEVGLMPSSTGRPGGKETGQNMGDYPIVGGLFEKAFKVWKSRNRPIRWASLEAFLEDGQAVNPTGEAGAEVTQSQIKKAKRRSKSKFSCPTCDQNAWGKPSSHLICGLCMKTMIMQT